MSIEIKNITKKFDKQLALDNVSFKVNTGEILGFLGPNGAGKSTLMKIITGYLAPDKGDVIIDGEKVDIEKTNFRNKIGYLPEHNPLYHEMYIKEYLSMSAGFYQLKNKTAAVNNVIEMTGLAPELKKKIGALSKGYKQRVGIAQALVHNPEILILDEPTSGLDPNQLTDIRNLIVDISADKTVMLSTHIMQEVEAICKRIVILNKGIKVADALPSEIEHVLQGKQQVVLGTANTIQKEDLEELDYIESVKLLNKNEFLITSAVGFDIRPKIFEDAVKCGWTILTLAEQARSVENIFKELTK